MSTTRSWPGALLCTAVLVFFGSVAPQAWSQQTVYKCANSYSQVPCPGAQVVDVQDKRTEEQRKQMQARTERTADLAETMQRQRLAQDGQETGIKPPPRPRVPLPVMPTPPTPLSPDAASDASAGNKPFIAQKPKLARPQRPDGFKAIAPKPGRAVEEALERREKRK